jgi:hypothetical protein
MFLKSVPKSSKILIVVSVFLSIITVLVLNQKNQKDTIVSDDSLFAVSDSGSVKKIVLVYKEKQVVLNFENNRWLVNNSFEGDKDKINQVLNFLYKVQVKRSIYKEEAFKINDVLSKNAFTITLYGQNSEIRKYKLAENKTDFTNLIAQMDGYQTAFLVQLVGFDGNLSAFLNINELDWKNTILFQSRLQEIDQVKVTFYQNPSDGFEINRTKNKFEVKNLQQVDTLRLYSYLQLFEKVKIAEYLPTSFQKQKDSLLNIQPTFAIELKDVSKEKSNKIDIFYKDNQQSKIYAFVGVKKELVTIKPSIFEYLLQKKSFFEKKIK